MDMRVKKHSIFIIMSFVFTLIVTSCVQGGSGKRSSSKTSDSVTGGSGDADGSGAIGDDANDLGSGDDSGLDIIGTSEVRHIVDPITGTYKTKVTIPKNFTGLLYLAGMNIANLSKTGHIVKVRFNFGYDLSPIEIPATIGRAPGITPQTTISVLTLDMNDTPFGDVRLLYDLFDYKDYTDPTTEIISDNRDTSLYCRGLRIQHDPTFSYDAVSNSKCDTNGEICQYAYAKVQDQGLSYDQTISSVFFPNLPSSPSHVQVDLAGSGYTSEPFSNSVLKCLPQYNDLASFNNIYNKAIANLTTPFIEGGVTYQYNGPFRAISESSWEISGTAVTDTTNGVWQAYTTNNGHSSMIFPLSTKRENFTAGIQYYGSAGMFDTSRTVTQLASSGDTLYMDGCNARVLNYNSDTSEGISSCNVTGTIEILAKSKSDSDYKIIATTTDVKLQLVRPSETNYRGEEVLYTSLKNCKGNSRICGTDECCYNERCWSKDIVTQCLEDANEDGNQGIGQVCSTDYQCSSLCCNLSTGLCAEHSTEGDNPVQCGKVAGQQCITSNFCKKEPVYKCEVLRFGAKCAQVCDTVMTNGECAEGTCRAPEQPDNSYPAGFDPLLGTCPAGI